MNDLDRIEHLLATAALAPNIFERCAQDLLSPLLPGLSPIAGGTDHGRDADALAPGEDGAVRLLVTSSRTYEGVRKNMLGGIKSMKQHGVAVARIVLASPAILSQLRRQKLVEAAKAAGVVLDVSEIFDGGFFGSALRRDGYWRKELLGLSSEPISLSRVPAELAESAWAQIPLVGRDGDISQLETDVGDVVLTGPPGVGKSRLAEQLDGVVFVDHDASFDRVDADLRWVLPEVVVIDDAGTSDGLVRHLRALRRAEPDLFRFRLIAICWPDEIERLTLALPGASVQHVQLMERRHLDELVVAMGIRSQLARGEILDQAEGRPGWAVALADVLLRSNDPASLVQGKALFGEVSRYLQRAGVGTGTVDLLALVASLGEVTELDLPRIASELGLPLPEVSRQIAGASRSGLIDVQTRYVADIDRELRHYQIRPPILADVLVAERVFGGSAPIVDLDRLLTRWPERLVAASRVAIGAALLGAPGARKAAERLYDRAMAEEATPARQAMALSEAFVKLDEAAGTKVLTLLRSDFDALIAGGEFDAWRAEPIVELAFPISGWYQNEDAVRLILDVSLWDQRAQHQNPNHPVRRLTDLVQHFHPEVPTTMAPRKLILATATGWVRADLDDPRRWVTLAALVGPLLSARLSSAFTHPGDPGQFQLFESILTPDGMRQLYAEVWPGVESLLGADHPEIISAAIDSAGGWLRVGRGFDRPFGQDHPREAVDVALEIGSAMVVDLARDLAGNIGALVRLRGVAELHDIEIPIAIPDGEEPFFRNVFPRGDDHDRAVEQLIDDVQTLALPWAGDDPDEAVARLLRLKDSSALAGIRWPDRVVIACNAIAAEVSDPGVWLASSIKHGLLPEAAGFARRVAAAPGCSSEDLKAMIDQPALRWEVMGTVLSDPVASDSFVGIVIENLTANDYSLLERLSYRGAPAPERAREILERARNEARGAMALALFDRGGVEDDWDPGDLESPWLSAVLEVRGELIGGARDYELARLFQWLARQRPSVLSDLVIRTLSESARGNEYGALSHSSWDVLHELPNTQKVRLWKALSAGPMGRWLLLEHLVGPDLTWLEEMVEADEITPDEALSSYRGFGPRPEIDGLARLLVPRGIEPVRIAALARSGSWSGEESNRLDGLVRQFTELANSSDERVRSVGEIGIQMFERERDEALERERIRRVRGEL
jgi:hypothetical protein